MTLEWLNGVIKVGSWSKELIAYFQTKSDDLLDMQVKYRIGRSISVEIGISRFGRRMVRQKTYRKHLSTPYTLTTNRDEYEYVPMFGLVDLPPMRMRCKGLYVAELPPIHELPWLDTNKSKLYDNVDRLREEYKERLASAKQNGVILDVPPRLHSAVQKMMQETQGL